MKDIILQNKYKIQQIIKKFTGQYNEDLEQEVYIKTFKNIDKYHEQNRFSQWICTIAANICKDYLKSAFYRYNHNNDSIDDIIIQPKAKSNPEKEYSLKEQQRITLSAINSLPKKLKQAIILYEFEDYSYEQISKKLNIPQGTVKSRINNARRILREKLKFLIGENNE